MDELLYLTALVVGIGGGFSFWKYNKTKKKAAVRTIRKDNEDRE
jgi:drug/metabolite transporter superfamily protein YnfA